MKNAKMKSEKCKMRRLPGFIFSTALFLLLLASRAAAAPQVTKMPNGLTVITAPRPGSPVTAVQLWVRAGAIDETDTNSGVSHFLEHMLFKGTTTRPVGSIHAEVEKNGGEINAATSDDWTYYHVTIASAEWTRALDIILDVAANASFPAEEVEREREVIKEEIARREDNPMAQLYDLMAEACYRRHPYRRPVIGTAAGMDRPTRDVLVGYYRRHYVPERMAVVVVGDFDSAVLRARLTATLARVPRSGFSELPRPSEWLTRAHTVSESGTTQLLYGAVCYPAPAASDLLRTATGDLLGEILAAPGTGRLTKKLVDRLRWCDEVSAFFPTARDASRFGVTFRAQPEYREMVRQAIEDEMASLVADDVTVEELSVARAHLASNLRRQHESAEDAAFDLGFWFAVTRAEDAARYERMLTQVTPADVRAFAAKYLRPGYAVTGWIEPSAAPEESLPPEAGAVITRASNSPVAAAGIFISGGQCVEPQPGWSALLAGVMSRGVEGRSYTDFQDELARLDMTVGASSQEDMLAVTGTCAPERLPLLVSRLCAMIENPNFADLDLVKEQQRDTLRARADQPFDKALEELARVRYPGHPYGRPAEGDETGIASADPVQLRAFLEKRLTAGRMHLVLVGDSATFAQARRVAAPRLAVSAAPPTALPPLAPAESRTVVLPAPFEQTLLFRSVAAPGIGEPGFAAWKVANAVLGGRSSSRLFRIVREEGGLAYAVGSFLPSRRLGSQLVCYAGTRPQNVAEVERRFERALDEPPSDTELAEAKRMILGEFALDHERSVRQCWYLGWYAALGVGAEFDALYPDLINRVTLRDVMDVFDEIRRAPRLELLYGARP